MAGVKSIDALVAVEAEEHRQPAPVYFSSAEREIWEEVIFSKPEEWFSRDNLGLLIEYCRVAVKTHWLHDKVIGLQAEFDQVDPSDVKAYSALLHAMDKFTKWQNVNSLQFMAYATKLRLTPQSRTDAKGYTEKGSAGTPIAAPWAEALPDVKSFMHERLGLGSVQ